MTATLAAGSAGVLFFVALVLLAGTGFERAAAAAAVLGLLLLSVAVTALAADRRPR
jgi:hypothetical protein